MSHSKKESSATLPGGRRKRKCAAVSNTHEPRPSPQTPDELPLISDDADLLAAGATMLARLRQSAEDTTARIAREEEYQRSYRLLGDAIRFMMGSVDNARFHHEVYDAAKHLPRLAELLADYFQVLRNPQEMRRVQSIDESAVLQKYKPNLGAGLAGLCLKYALRLFRFGVAGATKEQLEHKLAEVHAHEQLAGVWNWIVGLGYELGPDNRPQMVVNAVSQAPPGAEEPKPAWDKMGRVLTYGDRRLREYFDSAENQVTILASFQELNWPAVIDSPFPDNEKGRTQLKNAIKNLNKGLEEKDAIEFCGDGSGRHVCWRRL